MFPAPDDHPELRAPVANVIVANDIVAEELGNAGERVADDGAPDVADVHRLRDIGRAEVDDDLLRRIGKGNAEAFVLQKGARVLRDGFGFEAEVNESGAGDLRSVEQLVRRKRVD